MGDPQQILGGKGGGKGAKGGANPATRSQSTLPGLGATNGAAMGGIQPKSNAPKNSGSPMDSSIIGQALKAAGGKGGKG
jgi:hypothetical protein